LEHQQSEYTELSNLIGELHETDINLLSLIDNLKHADFGRDRGALQEVTP